MEFVKSVVQKIPFELGYNQYHILRVKCHVESDGDTQSILTFLKKERKKEKKEERKCICPDQS